MNFINSFGGMQLKDGLFNVFDKDEILYWEDNVAELFPDLKGCFRLFGFDWLGRCFGADLRKETHGQIMMFDPGLVEAYELPCRFVDFVNEEIPERHDMCLESESFYEWKSYTGSILSPGHCVGYSVPLFLGGKDDFDNLEVTDMDVYWSINAQLKDAVSGMAEGTVVDKFEIE